MDLPDQPDEASRAERARDASAARPQKREMPDPDERGRAYEAIAGARFRGRDRAGELLG